VNNAVRDTIEFTMRNKLLQASDSIDPTDLEGMLGRILTHAGSPQLNDVRVKIWGK
jgi:hypothetical protein